jgi:hypothetical protein
MKPLLIRSDLASDTVVHLCSTTAGDPRSPITVHVHRAGCPSPILRSAGCPSSHLHQLLRMEDREWRRLGPLSPPTPHQLPSPPPSPGLSLSESLRPRASWRVPGSSGSRPRWKRPLDLASWSPDLVFDLLFYLFRLSPQRSLFCISLSIVLSPAGTPRHDLGRNWWRCGALLATDAGPSTTTPDSSSCCGWSGHQVRLPLQPGICDAVSNIFGRWGFYASCSPVRCLLLLTGICTEKHMRVTGGILKL